MNIIIVLFLTFCFVVVKSASLEKLNGVYGLVKVLEFDSKSDAFIITAMDFGDRFYKLDSQNQVIFTRDFTSVSLLKINSQDDVYIFDQVDKGARNVWVLNSKSLTISNSFNYSASADLPAFFDSQDNLLLDSTTGIGILLNGNRSVNLIPRLAGWHFITKENSFDADSISGISYIAVRKDLTVPDRGISLVPTEIIKPDPHFLVFNLNQYGNIQSQKLFNLSHGNYLSLCFVLDKAILQVTNVNTTVLYEMKEPGYGDFHVTGNRIFVRHLESGICYVKEITSPDTLTDTGISFKGSCNIYQASDKSGTTFFGSSDYGSVVWYIANNGTVGKINIRNTFFIYGMATTDDGNLWILTQYLTVVPFGLTTAVSVSGLPYPTESWPFKAKPGSNTVFIGSEDGIYVGIS